MCELQRIMTKDFIAVGPDTSIDEAVSLLLDHKISGLPVIDDEGQLVGVISEVDIIDLVYSADIDTSTVRDNMTLDTRSLEEDASLDDAADLFCTHNIRRIPIVRDGRLVGIVSRRDLIRFVRDIRKLDKAQQANEPVDV
ncbi:MAG: CBS domain-containing protein [Planctomycetes bacterium]|nr:CBS domain-containing protein [Planctomycetota bacterium]